MARQPASTKTIFTTGEVAKFCQVCPRTVQKWFDSGQLEGFRIPGSKDRRVPRANLIDFLTKHGMPIPRALMTGNQPEPAQ